MTFKHSVSPYFKTPKRMRKTPQLTIRQMAERIPKSTRLKSRKVGIVSVKRGRVPAFLKGWTAYRGVTQNTENGNRYRISIYVPTRNVTLDTKAIIDSPNPLFVFRYEYALAKRGNAYIYRSNGDPPNFTNPGLIPGFDHHVYRLIQYLIKQTNSGGLRE